MEQEKQAADQRERELLECNMATEKQARLDAAEMASAMQGDFTHRADTDVADQNLIVLIEAANPFLSGGEASLSATGDVLMDLSHGNLRVRMDGFYEGVFKALQGNMNQTLETLEEMVEEISSSGQTVSLKSDEIQASADDLARRTEKSTASLEDAAAAMDENSATAQSVSENISSVSKSVTIVAEAMQAVSEVSDAIGVISKQTSEAADAVDQQAAGLAGVNAPSVNLMAQLRSTRRCLNKSTPPVTHCAARLPCWNARFPSSNRTMRPRIHP